jgi:hypothetical protein
MTTREKIIEKIRGLIALSSSPYPAEAAAALAKASRLMLDYSIQPEEVKDVKDEMVEMVEIIGTFGNKVQKAWMGYLAASIAQAFFCKVLWTRKVGIHPREKELGVLWVACFFGKKTNAEMAAYVYDQLGVKLLAMAEKAAHEYVEMLKGKGIKDPFKTGYLRKGDHPNGYRNSYLMGAVFELYNKVQEFFNSNISKSESTAIISLGKEVEEAYAKAYQNVKKGKISNAVTNPIAAAKGMKDAQELSIHPGIDRGN